MKKFFLNIWYNILFQFDNHRDSIPVEWIEEHKEFNQYPEWIQRVHVAKDVIEQLNNSVYKASKGNYISKVNLNTASFYHTDSETTAVPDIDVKTTIDKLKSCNVCAMGACILSITKFKNKLKWRTLLAHKNFTEYSPVIEMLQSLFSPYQLALIEAAFEGRYNDSFTDRVAKTLGVRRLSDEDELKCRKFNYLNTDFDNLRLIMQNIIDNKGTFKP